MNQLAGRIRDEPTIDLVTRQEPNKLPLSALLSKKQLQQNTHSNSLHSVQSSYTGFTVLAYSVFHFAFNAAHYWLLKILKSGQKRRNTLWTFIVSHSFNHHQGRMLSSILFTLTPFKSCLRHGQEKSPLQCVCFATSQMPVLQRA